MMEFNIYQEEMVGSYLVDVISALNKEEALNVFFSKKNVREEDKWMFHAGLKKKADEDEARLKEVGYSSWDEYYKDMYPDRPIEL